MGRRDDHHQLEEGCELMLDWRKLHKVATCGDDVVPVAVQDADTREMLILAYANEHALAEARRRGVRRFEFRRFRRHRAPSVR